MRITRIAPELVDLAPRILQPGRLYISQKYRAAVHLCCCGCGEKVVTPLSPAEWRVHLTDGHVTLHPSVGNWSMACRSHYVIRDNRVIWAAEFSQRQIKAVFARDQRDLTLLHQRAGASPDAARLPPAPPSHSPAQPARRWLRWVGDLWRRLVG